MLLQAGHARQGAQFADFQGQQIVEHYGDVPEEHRSLRNSAGLLDLSFRGRVCLTGADRARFLHGQVTNNVKDLAAGEGCYAALVSAKGKLESDLNVYVLPAELLLDFEPGLTAFIAQRFDKYIIADDVQVVDASPLYGLLSVQGPQAEAAIRSLPMSWELPVGPMGFTTIRTPDQGEMYVTHQARTGSTGYDFFAPNPQLAALWDLLREACRSVGGRPCGWRALETARIEAGIPRFGQDMDASNLAPEAGIADRAISYTKGCYIGQEIIARLRTYGQVAKSLRGLRLADGLAVLPQRGDRLICDGKEAGYVTSAVHSPTFNASIALGYVRREWQEPGTEFVLHSNPGESPARLVLLPFHRNFT